MIFYTNFRIVVAVTLFLFINCNGHKLISIDEIYQKGVEAYTKERWSECISKFEEALHLYKVYTRVIVQCRLKCNSQQYKSQIDETMEDLKTYEKFFNTRHCLNNCQGEEFKPTNLNLDVPDSVISNMQRRKPYEYLHICYFQMNAMPKAASAVYTHLMANPHDEAMKNNLNYYIEQPEVDRNEVEDLESENYMDLFSLGLQSYKKNNWVETVASMEEVLTDYLSWENICRTECERQPEQEWSPEFTITVSNNIAALLHCRQQCQDRLEQLGYKLGVDFLADVLNYIQISYYKLDRFKDAAEAVASYLSLLPNDEDMLENKKIYSTITDSSNFISRSDILYYFKRDNHEKNLLNFFHLKQL